LSYVLKISNLKLLPLPELISRSNGVEQFSGNSVTNCDSQPARQLADLAMHPSAVAGVHVLIMQLKPRADSAATKQRCGLHVQPHHAC
jgi:hypothetical protein